jgi:hypothetical protein
VHEHRGRPRVLRLSRAVLLLRDFTCFAAMICYILRLHLSGDMWNLRVSLNQARADAPSPSHETHKIGPACGGASLMNTKSEAVEHDARSKCILSCIDGRYMFEM